MARTFVVVIFLMPSPFSDRSLIKGVSRNYLKYIIQFRYMTALHKYMLFGRQNLFKSEVKCQDYKRPSVSLKSLREISSSTRPTSIILTTRKDMYIIDTD